MTQFRYQATQEEGNTVTGEINADSEDDAAGQLLAQGLTPVDICPAGSGGTSASKDINIPILNALADRLPGKKVKPGDLIIFFRQMKALMEAGLPLLDVLEQLANTTPSKELKAALTNVMDTLHAGQPLTEGFKRSPHIFTPVMVNIIATGEKSGQIEMAFATLIVFLEFDEGAKKKVKSALRYPLITLAASLIAMLVMTLFVIPNFADLFGRFNSDLPLPTKIILNTSNFMMAYKWYLLGLTLAAVGAVLYWKRTDQGKIMLGKCLFRIPILGNMLQRIFIMRFAQLFYIVFKSGLGIIESLEQVSDAIGNPYFSQCLMKIKDNLIAGQTLYDSAQGCPIFNPIMLQMLKVGEESGALHDMLKQIGIFYKEEVDYDLDRMQAIISPLLMVVLAIMILILALGIFLPMWEFINVAWK